MSIGPSAMSHAPIVAFSGGKKMRIIIADDHLLLLDALESYLEMIRSDMEIEKAVSFEQALETALERRPDLVILDLNMPGMNGFDGLRKMMDAMPEVPVVLMSGQASAEDVRGSLKRGAAGFIPKDLDGPAMLKALELVLCGGVFVPTLALATDTATTDREGDESYEPDNPLGRLTRRQSDVLKLLARGLTNKEIAKELGVKEVTVAVHLGSIFRKLRVSRRTEAVATSVRLGMKV